MSQADELLNSLNNEGNETYISEQETESHIIIDSDRFITVPEELKRIAVQFDHNIETVTFDCPRYWDGLDMSSMKVYINYRCPDGTLGSYIADNVTVDESDSSIMHFDWLISRNVSSAKGNLAFLVCIKKTNSDGLEENHWNSELNTSMYISEGLECEDIIDQQYPDLCTQLLYKMDEIENDFSEYSKTASDTINVSKSYAEEAKTCSEEAASTAANAEELLEKTTKLVETGGLSKTIDMLTDVLGNWNNAGGGNTSVGSSTLYGVTYGNGMFVAVGNNVTYYSIDGKTWTAGSGASGNLKDVTYANSMFVIVGSNVTYYSTDGINWTAGSGISGILYGVTYANGMFVAVGSSVTYYSTDGKTWTAGSGASGYLRDVTYANGMFVIVSDNCTYYSTDGKTWTAGSGISGILYGVTYANGMFVAVGSSGGAYYSTFKKEYRKLEEVINELYPLIEKSNYFLAPKKNFSGDIDSIVGKYMTGVYWCVPGYSSTTDQLPFDTNNAYFTLISLTSIGSGTTHIAIKYSSTGLCDIRTRMHGNGKWYPWNTRFGNTDISEIGDGSITGAIKDLSTVDIMTDELENWTAGSGASGSLRKATYGNGMFVAVGNNVTYYSIDGKTWTAGSGASGNLRDVTYANSMFVIVGSRGYTSYSTDGKTWKAGSSVSGNLQGVTYGNGKFVAVGNKVTYYSIDGKTWKAGNGASGSLYGATYGNGKFVAVGYNATYYSTDGINWTAGNGASGELYGVTYGNGKFVAVGIGGYTAYSTDGKTWKAGSSVSSDLYGITYGNGMFVIVGIIATYYSTDGINWTAGNGASGSLYGATYGNGKFVAVGSNGATYYSTFKKETKSLEDAINELYALSRS